MLGAPIALWLLRRGWWWAVAGASLVVRLLSPEFDFRWQTLFYGGMIAGFHLHAVEFWFGERQGARRVLAALVLSFAAVTLVASVSIVLLQTQLATLGWSGATLARWNDQLAPYFDKGLLPWPRLVMFALWFGAIYIVFRRYEAPIAHYVGWFLLPLGRNSLYAYIVHALLVLATASTIAHPAGLIGNIAISTGVLGVMWLCTVNRLGMGIIPR
jgi:hypothetical protein